MPIDADYHAINLVCDDPNHCRAEPDWLNIHDANRGGAWREVRRRGWKVSLGQVLCKDCATRAAAKGKVRK